MPQTSVPICVEVGAYITEVGAHITEVGAYLRRGRGPVCEASRLTCVVPPALPSAPLGICAACTCQVSGDESCRTAEQQQGSFRHAAESCYRSRCRTTPTTLDQETATQYSHCTTQIPKHESITSADTRSRDAKKFHGEICKRAHRNSMFGIVA